MGNINILVANEPRSYREAIASTLRALRPNVGVTEVEPEALDREVERLRPDLVVCSNLTTKVEELAPAWIVLYPGDNPVGMISTAGELSTITNIELNNLLSVVDQVADLSSSNYT